MRILAAQTGTFVDRQLPTDLRVVSYNVLWNRIFPELYPTQAAKFERVVQAIDATIPEPASLALCLTAALLVAHCRR